MFCARSQFDWPITQKKKKKLWRLPKLKGSILKIRVPPLLPTYKTFVQAYGIKVRCYEEHVGEPIGNLRNILRTHWELNGNIHQEPRKIEKTILHTPKLKRKKRKTPWWHALGLPIGCCIKFLFPKELVTIFGLG